MNTVSSLVWSLKRRSLAEFIVCVELAKVVSQRYYVKINILFTVATTFVASHATVAPATTAVIHSCIAIRLPSFLRVDYRNPSLGLVTKAKGLQGCGPRGSPRVTSERPESAGECEGVSLHTPKATPKLGEGVLVDSRNFRDRFEGSNLNGWLRFLYQ